MSPRVTNQSISNYIKQYINLKQVFSSIIVSTNYGGVNNMVMLIIFCFFPTGLTLLRPMTFPGLHGSHVN